MNENQHSLLDEVLSKINDFREQSLTPRRIVLWGAFKDELYKETYIFSKFGSDIGEDGVITLFGLEVEWTDKSGVIEVY